MSDPGDETNFIDTVIHKAAMGILMADSTVDDLAGFNAELAFGIREITPKESASMNRRMREYEELKTAGLLDDNGDQIKPTDCPACYDIADGTAAGWNGPLGDYVRCERPRGHDGNHMYTVLWGDDERNVTASRG